MLCGNLLHDADKGACVLLADDFGKFVRKREGFLVDG